MSEVPSDLPGILATAQAAFAEGGPGAALQTLGRTLKAPVPPAPDPTWAGLFQLLASAAKDAELGTLASKAAVAGTTPAAPQALYDLGYELIEVQAPSLAAVILERAHVLSPISEAILSELATAHELDLRCGRALGILKAAPGPLQERFMIRYLTAFHAAMAGDLETTRELAPKLAGQTDKSRVFMADTITGILARADSLAGKSALDAKDLRGWHYVLSGGILTHLSPHGFDEGMAGRYASVFESPPLVREGLERLKLTLATLGLTPPRILVLAERASEILAEAASRVLGLPMAPFDVGPGLVVAYDLGRLPQEDLEPLLSHRPDQLLFAQAVCWTDEPPFAPDLASLLHQFDRAPWEPAPGFDPETKAPKERPADPRPAAEIGAELAALAPDPLADRPDLEAFLAATRTLPPPHGPGALRRDGRRRRMYRGSPVASSRFL